jgi:hypothetical protein
MGGRWRATTTFVVDDHPEQAPAQLVGLVPTLLGGL